MSIFDSLVGQSEVVERLKGAVEAAKSGKSTQEMVHTWLFVGPAGSGRSNAAVAFAAALLCSDGGCGKCLDCQTVLAGTHIDLERFNPNKSRRGPRVNFKICLVAICWTLADCNY
jgi:DNA polymerase-3 subunit delta'